MAQLAVCGVGLAMLLSCTGCQVTEGGQTRFYVRTGNTTQELNPKESVEYAKANWA